MTPARPFLVLPVGFTLAAVRWIEADPEAALEADLDRDGLRRRWLSTPADVIERYRAEVDAEETEARRTGRRRAKVEAAERRSRLLTRA